jgi:prolipoprotein diacylglyceryltransferase
VLAVITLDFDPTVSPFGLPVRLETLALATVVLLVLVLVAIRAGMARPVGEDAAAATGRRSGRLRRDDLILFAFGAIPGAIVGGRLGYGLVHLDFYSADQGALLDPAGGGLSLTLAVALGTLCAMAVARLLSAPVGRWLGAARGPVLLGLGLGKLATVLGGAGQGSYSESSWATSYVGRGPWESLNAQYAALPSQAIEGILVLVALALLVIGIPALARVRVEVTREAIEIGLWPPDHAMPPGEGRGFAVGLIFWAVARFIAAFTWRDAHILGPLNGEQLVLVGLVAILLVILVVPAVRRGFRASMAARGAAAAETPARAESDAGAKAA